MIPDIEIILNIENTLIQLYVLAFNRGLAIQSSAPKITIFNVYDKQFC